MTNILLITIGSRGDIQPFIALGKGLQAAGHTVALQTAESYRPMVEAHGIAYQYMNNGFMALTESKAGQAATEGGGKGFALIKQVMPLLRSMLDDEWAAVQAFQPDVIVYHPKSLGGYHFAEKLGIPAFLSVPLPLYTPTAAYPNPVVPPLPLGAGYNRFTYKLMGLATAPYMGVINDFRVNVLGLPKRGRFASELVQPDGTPTQVLYPYSRHVLPIPADYPPSVHVTGYWTLDHDSELHAPPADLAAFLAAGAPPVYVGFGSMSGAKASQRAEIVLEALMKSGQRGVLASGWGGLKPSALPDSVFMIDQAPHGWLFPRMAAVVHHGGAGTTAAGLRAGKPTVIVPFIADQPFWGRVVADIGAGPAPIPQGKLTADNLAAAITQAVSDSAMRQKAESIGSALRAEDGVRAAVEVITQRRK